MSFLCDYARNIGHTLSGDGRNVDFWAEGRFLYKAENGCEFEIWSNVRYGVEEYACVFVPPSGRAIRLDGLSCTLDAAIEACDRASKALFKRRNQPSPLAETTSL